MHMGVNRRTPHGSRLNRPSCPHAHGGEPTCRYDAGAESCPHAHGGEPPSRLLQRTVHDVVPMHMGVNRRADDLEARG